MKKAIMMYSLGKDSTAAFIKAKEDGYVIDKIITMYDKKRELSSVHMAKKNLINYIASHMGVEILFLGKEKNGDFNKQWKKLYLDVKKQGYKYMVHGDIFLKDVKKFKDDHALKSGVTNVYPLWGMGSKFCANYILDMGIDSYVTVTNKKELIKWIGKKYSEMLPHLPKGCDPCGENGEFHTIIFKAPFLPKKLEYEMQPVKQLENIFGKKTFNYWYTIISKFK